MDLMIELMRVFAACAIVLKLVPAFLVVLTGKLHCL